MRATTPLFLVDYNRTFNFYFDSLALESKERNTFVGVSCSSFCIGHDERQLNIKIKRILFDILYDTCHNGCILKYSLKFNYVPQNHFRI